MSLETASSQKSFSVRMSGNNISPEAVPVNDLVELLKHFQKLVKDYLKDQEAAPLLSDNTVHTSQISLAGIQRGSAVYEIAAGAPAISAIVATSEAVNSRDYSQLPTSVVEELREISEFGRKNHIAIELAHNESSIETVAKLDADSLPPLPYISGTTTLLGTCFRVGGREPRALIQPASGGRTISAKVSQEVAKQLATHLYEEVLLEGSAIWRSDTWEVKDFRVSQVVSYQGQDLGQAFKRLAEAAGGRWDDTDAAEYVTGLRSEDWGE